MYFWKEESRRETGVRNVGVMTETPDMEQISVRAFQQPEPGLSLYHVSMFPYAGLLGQTPVEAPCFGQELLSCTAPSPVPYHESWKEGRVLGVCGFMA